MYEERVLSSRPDREIAKTIVGPGDFTIVPYEDARCKIRLRDVQCRDKNGPCPINIPESRIFNSPFDGNVIIGDMDAFIDKDFELVLQQMCYRETSIARMTYKNAHGDLVKEVTCRIHMIDITEEQLISDWSWARLYESAIHHKERGVQLVKDKRIVDGFRRFSKSLKMLVAIEPVEKGIVDDERCKELTNLRVSNTAEYDNPV